MSSQSVKSASTDLIEDKKQNGKSSTTNTNSDSSNLDKQKKPVLNEHLIDNSSSESSVSDQKLKIDIDDDDSNDKSKKKRNDSSLLNCSKKDISENGDNEMSKSDKKIVSDERKQTDLEKESNLSTSEDLNTSQNPSETSSVKNSGYKRPIDRGLDGGYWSRMSVGEMLSDNKPKRTRRSVDHLNISANNRYYNEFSLDDHEESKTASRLTKSAPEKRIVLFAPKTWLTVRNEEGSFFLCQCINKIYENSKQSKIQWLEGENEKNSYVWGETDFISPNTIIAKVNVTKKSLKLDESKLNQSFYEIDKDDLNKVNSLLSQALTEGGIEHEIDQSLKDSSDSDQPKKASEILSDDDIYEKEEDEPLVKKGKKKKKKVLSSGDSSSGESESDRVKEESVKKKIRVKSPIIQNKPKSFEEYKKQLLKNKQAMKNSIASDEKRKSGSSSSSVMPKLIASPLDSAMKIKKKTDLLSAPKDSVFNVNKNKSPESIKISKPSVSSIAIKSVDSQRKIKLLSPEDEKKILKRSIEVTSNKETKKAVKTPKASNKSDNDTDHLDSDNESIKKQSKKEKNKDTSPKETINMKKMPVQENQNTVAVQQSKKRRLFKVISNRYLDPNPKVSVYAKDPFFEEAGNEAEIPFVSPYVQSKLAFKALHLGDINMLKKLIDDVENVPSVHVGKSLCSKWIPAEYALYLENKEALEILIDNFVAESNKGNTNNRIEMPETMFQKFSNGNYNARSLGTPFTRKLTESRGVKEGNNAFIKDNETLSFVRYKPKQTFFSRLFNLAIEYGISVEMFDFLLAKWTSVNDSPSNNIFMLNHSVNFIYENVIQAILFGHRKLAAHILEKAPSGLGFNAVHIEVLSAENDSDLKCKLRANMCTKKPFGNDFVTPIHCACINQNVKYLKTLLSITQEYNIADKRGRKPIHYAAVCEGLSPLEYLISRVSPYELDSNGCIPLHYACLAGRCINVEMLLGHARSKQEDDSTVTTEIIMDNKYGIGGLNKPNKRGQLPIHLAISRNNYDCIKVLIKYGCNLEYPLPNSMGKITPLMYACQLGHQKIVQLLIENNAKIEARDRHQRTATIHTAMCGHSRTLSYLLRLGANPNACDSSGNSVLHYACAYGWYYCIKVLLDAGAQVNVLNDWKLTPFGTAFLKGHVGLCDQLLVLYPKQIDINFRTEDGETLVMLAVSSAGTFNRASVDQLKYIVNKLGGNCRLTDSKGSNAFHYLASNVIDNQLIESQVEQNSLNRSQLVENLYNEQSKYRNQIAEILLKNECNPNAENTEFETPFFTAISNSNLSFAKYLIEKINVRITARQSPNGKTLLSLMAEKCIDLNIISIIQDNKENFKRNTAAFKTMAKIRNENGQTPFQIACKKVSEAGDRTKLPEGTSSFLMFLYNECESNPNDWMTMEIIDHCNKRAKRLGFDYASNTKSVSSSNTYQIRPISLLLFDKNIGLIESLIKEKEKNPSLVSIDFINSYDENGLTPILKALSLKQSKVIIKLIELGILSADKICSHYSVQLNEKQEKMIDESILQTAIRYGLSDVFEACINTLIQKPVDSALFKNFLKHQNLKKQNFLHYLTYLDQPCRSLFSSSRLTVILQTLNTFFKTDLSFDFSTFILEMIAAKDKIGRTVYHSALVNFNSQLSIELEMFLLDQIMTIDSARTGSNSLLRTKIFSTQDIFGRLPIHYLFFDTKKFKVNAMNEIDFYALKNPAEKLSVSSVHLKHDQHIIDPVEILTVLIKQMDVKELDKKDFAGYTPLHYAALRGSSISCTMLISNGCSIFESDNNNNTPISSAIYFKRETCALTLLHNLKENKPKQTNDSLNQQNYSLKSFYYLQEEDIDATEQANDETSLEPDWKWTRNIENDLYPIKKISLYKLILSHKWEGISWLVLGELNNYGLDQFDAIQAAVLSLEFSFAVRLLEKFLRETQDSMFRINLCSHVYDESNGQTLLHLISNLNLSPTHYESVRNFLRVIFKSNDSSVVLPDIGLIKKQDKFGTTALHYACHMHNFAVVDSFLEHFEECSLEILTQKDSASQSAYSLLFWQIGRVTYSNEIKEKIKSYTLNHIKKSDNSEYISRAYFPLTDSFLLSAKVGKLLRDYPYSKKDQLISPLIYAINRQDFEMTKFIIKDLQFNINTSDSMNRNALVYAIQTNNLRMCKILLNPDFEAEMEQNSNKNAENGKNKKVSSRFRSLFQNKAPTADDSEASEEELENNDESMNDETRDEGNISISQTEDLLFPQLEVKSAIVLNQQDNKQMTIFHHLACGLKYGSFHNVVICKLLFAAFNYVSSNRVSQSNHRALPSLVDFLKRTDSKMMSASDYAFKNGNLALYEEIQKCLGNLKPIGNELIHNKFTIQDSFYNTDKPDYIKDSNAFLKSKIELEGDYVKESISECFKVDSLSNMSNTGSIVWDEKTNIPYDVVLTKTDVTYGLYGMHNFYKMQLISQNIKNNQGQLNGSDKKEEVNGENKFDPTQMCVLFTRWGRIGDAGQCQRTPFSTFKEARDEFCKVFKLKTANDFNDTVLEKKKPFENKLKRYTLIQIESRKRQKLRDYSFELFDESEKSAVFEKSMFKGLNDYKEFLGDLLNVNYIKNQIDTSLLSTDYIPITQLSFDAIQTASDILNKKLKLAIDRRMELEKLNKKENLPEYMSILNQINQLSNDYYDLIPQMNYNYERLPPISTERELEIQLSTINRLTNAHMGIRILMGAKSSSLNPFDYVYKSMNVKLELMSLNEPETQYVLRYIDPNQIQSDVKIKRVFKVQRPGETERFESTKLPSSEIKIKNRYLLWHGTGTENLISIMSKGLVVAPNEAKHNGNRYGKGIYFSDSFQESSLYSEGMSVQIENEKITKKYMLLCEVALGNVKELKTYHETVDSLPAGYDSVKALGKVEPNPNGNISMPNGSICPLGEPIDSSKKNNFGHWRNSNYSQYIVYDESQVVIRYIVQYYV